MRELERLRRLRERKENRGRERSGGPGLRELTCEPANKEENEMRVWQLISTVNGEVSATHIQTKDEAVETYQRTMFQPEYTHAELWEISESERVGGTAICLSFWDENTQTYGVH